MVAGNSCQVTLGCTTQANGSTLADTDTLTIISGNWNGSACVTCPTGQSWSAGANACVTTTAPSINAPATAGIYANNNGPWHTGTRT